METLKDYAVSAITAIIPLDQESAAMMVEYALSIERDAEVINHFKGILGDSDDAVAFIGQFLQRRKQLKGPTSSSSTSNSTNSTASSSTSSSTTKASQKQKIQLHRDQQKKPSDVPAWGAVKATPQKTTTQGRLANVATSTTTSGLLNATSSSLSSQTKQAQKRSKRKNIDNLKDIEAVLNELEIGGDNQRETNSPVSRVCNCMGTRHPLFEVAPNCLNCGKIICAKEGLQPCSFCGADLLSPLEILEIVGILEHERAGLEDSRAVSSSSISSTNSGGQLTPKQKQQQKKITVSMRPGENLWQAQDRMLKAADKAKKKAAQAKEDSLKEAQELEQQLKQIQDLERTSDVDPALLKAQERLDTLLHFQDTGAERTKIIDNAADFEMPTVSSGSMWLTPTERALQLKKQQKLMRKYEGEAAKRSGRGKRVVEMVIKDGKVVMQERVVDEDVTDGAEENLEQQIRQRRQAETELTTWDYEKDAQTWEKPRYVFGESEREEGEEGDAVDKYVPRLRVQVVADAEQNELLA